MLETYLQAVSEWGDRTGPLAFPTGERTATASPHLFDYRLVVLGAGVAEKQQVRLADLGLDPDHATNPGLPFWRERLAATANYANSAKAPNGPFVHGYPDFRQSSSTTGPRLGVTLLRGGPAVTKQQVAATTILPDPSGVLLSILGSAYFTIFDGLSWLRGANTWARAQGLAGALPTGLVSQAADGSWTVEVLTVTGQAADVRTVRGPELFVSERCAEAVGLPATVPTPALDGGDVFTGIAEPAPLAIDEAPFTERVHFPAEICDYARCLAAQQGKMTAALFLGDEPIRMTMTPRTDGRTVVYFENGGNAGAWIVAHRLDPETKETAGEVAAVWKAPGTPGGIAFETTPGEPGPGQLLAHSVGFVKQGIAGVAVRKGSFSWSTYARLTPGMNLTFVWRAL